MISATVLNAKRRQYGMSLVELMIAMLLGLIIIGGSIQVFVSSKVSYNVADGLARIQENARYSMDLLNREVRMLGGGSFCGGVDTTFIDGEQDTCAFDSGDDRVQICSLLDDDAEQIIAGNGLAIFEANNTGSGTYVHSISAPPTGGDAWTPALPGILQGRVLSGTDVLGISYIGLVSNDLTICEPVQPNRQNRASLPTCNRENDRVSPPDRLVNSLTLAVDCGARRGDLFVNMRNGGGGGGDNNGVVINRNRQGSQWFTDYGGNTSIYQASAFYYYVGESGASANTPGEDVRPALFRARLNSDDEWVHEELAEGVDNLQLFVRTEVAPGWLPSPGAAGDLAQVNAVKINLMASSPEDVEGRELNIPYVLDNGLTVTVSDQRVRQVYTNTVAIRGRNRPADDPATL
jgi:type IV pilus assembly protein PilW